MSFLLLRLRFNLVPLLAQKLHLTFKIELNIHKQNFSSIKNLCNTLRITANLWKLKNNNNNMGTFAFRLSCILQSYRARECEQISIISLDDISTGQMVLN